MASRAFPGNLTRPQLPARPNLREWATVTGRRITAVWDLPLRLLLLRAITFPFWTFSDVPAPITAADDDVSKPSSPAGLALFNSLEKVRRRTTFNWTTSLLVRAVTLGLGFGVIWQAIALAGGPDVHGRTLIAVTIAFGLMSIVIAFVVRPRRRQVARMLDRSFDLKERIATAYENLSASQPGEGERASLSYLQLADAANAASSRQKHPSLRARPPWREIALTVVVALLFTTLYFLRGTTGGVDEVVAQPVPKFVSAAERFVREVPVAAPAAADVVDKATLQKIQQLADESAEATEDLSSLAAALDDHAITQPIADAINRGDYPAAVEGLRSLAEDASSISEETREGLANDLESASELMSSSESGLAEASTEAAEGLRGSDQEATEGLSELAQEVEQTAGGIASQEELQEMLESAQSPSNPAEETSPQDGEQPGNQPGSNPENGPGSNEENPGNPSAGTSSEQAEPGEPGDQQPGGDSEQPGGGNPEDRPGEAASASDPTEGDTETSEPGGEGNSTSGAPEEANQSDQAGPGGGPGNAKSSDDSASPGGEGDSKNGEPEEATGEANVVEGEEPTGPGQESTDEDRTSMELEDSGGENGVPISGSSGGSTQGSGAGVVLGSGNAEQGELGDSGPDSNHVPAEYRSIVRDYFTDPNEP